MLNRNNLLYKYEAVKLHYIQPEQKRLYTADFTLDDFEAVILEAKGQFTSADRKKMLLLKEQYPDKVFLMVFGRPLNTLSKKSKTTYIDWCEKNKILWMDIKALEADPSALTRFLKENNCQSSTTKRKRSGNSESKPTTRKNSTRFSKSVSK